MRSNSCNWFPNLSQCFKAGCEKLVLYLYCCLYSDVNFLDGDGNILIPKSVRPIMDHGITLLGDKKGCQKQYRYGNLHIREYESHYSVHLDKVDPRVDPLGHLMADAPNYLVGLLSMASMAKRYLESTEKI